MTAERFPDPAGDVVLWRILGRYLRYTERYDRWGPTGKLMVVQEILREDGIALSRDGLERVVDMIFPRTYTRPLPLPASQTVARHVARYYHERLVEFTFHALGPDAALRETADRFACTPQDVEGFLG